MVAKLARNHLRTKSSSRAICVSPSTAAGDYAILQSEVQAVANSPVVRQSKVWDGLDMAVPARVTGFIRERIIAGVHIVL